MTFLSRRVRRFALPALLFATGACSSTDQLVSPAGLRPSSTSYTDGSATVVISQVYGGGGNAGATWRNDFIELYNASTNPVSLNGWSVQYASATGTSWQVTPLTNVTLQPGQYYLVQEAAGANVTTSTPLPAPDASGTIPMAAGAGKVALVSSTTALSGNGGSTGLTAAAVNPSCPASANIVDFVGFGTAATCAETAPTATIANATAAIRKSGGKTDANNNGADFDASTTLTASVTPNPRNTTSPINPVTPPTAVASVVVSPSTATVQVGSNSTFSASAKDADDKPTSTSFTWSSSSDAIATVNTTTGVATGVAPGTVTITATSANSVTGSATLTVVAAPPPPPPADLPAVRFSELHYDNAGTDAGEGIEIEAPAGTDLTNWSVQLYNGNGGAMYSTRVLSGLVASQCDGRGVVVLEYPANGIQNGGSASPEPDGMALIDPNGAVVEFLSYEGVMTATIGGNSVTSTDIGVAQLDAPAGTSLQRSLAGTWASAASNFYGCNGRTPGRQITVTTVSIFGRDASDAPLPVGFEGQIFANATNGTGPVPFVWSVDTPALASIDADGVITAKAAGTAVFRATTTDGLYTATYSLEMAVGVASTLAQYVGNTAFGEPFDASPANDLILRRNEYTSSFNTTTNIPNWVAYNLEQTHRATGADRCNCFTFDPELPQANRYTTAAFTGVGSVYNRGHLVRSADRTTGTLDNARTYYFSNIIPQAADNNQGPWAAFETYLGDLALQGDKEIYIIAGASGNIGTLKNEGKVVIPENVWKVAVIMPRNQGLANFTSTSSAEVISVIMPNVNGIRNVPWQNYTTTVNAVQQLSGYDVLAALAESVECKVEVRNCLPEPLLVSASGSATATAGSPFVLNTSASDADGANGPWRYVLEWGDGTSFTTTLSSLPASSRPLARAKTYAAPGTYTVTLTITDKNGGKGVQTFVVTVN